MNDPNLSKIQIRGENEPFRGQKSEQRFGSEQPFRGQNSTTILFHHELFNHEMVLIHKINSYSVKRATPRNQMIPRGSKQYRKIAS